MLLILYNLIFLFIVESLLKATIGFRNIKFFQYIFCFFNVFLVINLFFFNMINTSEIILLTLFDWLKCFELIVKFQFIQDSLSVSMLLVVITIASLVKIYSLYYMKTDINIIKFLSYLSLFTIFMFILVSSSNFLVLFLGWEGVGLCSFLLISFWNTRIQANKSAFKAMLINRIGDFFLIIAIVLLYINFSSIDYYTVFSYIHVYQFKSLYLLNIKINVITIICFFILIGSITKSAQIIFHGWLPDAMEGPTPVSALIHAATMVTAGVFLIIRCSYIFEFSSTILDLTKYFGVITIVSFGLVAIFQYDIKKIIAYSTCSQLGYMILCCGLSGYSIALFHLFTHASFKALLFLSAGTIIHAFNNEQDLRKINNINNILPLVSVSFIIGSLAIIGIPFFAGFFSKEPILLLSFLYKQNIQIYYFAIFGVCLTTIYSLKILYYIFFKSNTSFKFNYKQNRNSTDYHNIFVIVILSILSITVGYIFKTWFIGIGNNNFYGVIFSYNKYFLLHKFEFINFFIKSAPLLLITLIILFFIYSVNNNYFIKLPYNLILFFTKKLFFDSLINFFGFWWLQYSFKLYKHIEKGFLEVTGPTGLSKLTKYLIFYFYNFFMSQNLFMWFKTYFLSLFIYIILIINIYYGFIF